MSHEKQKLAYTKGFLWLFFGAAAMLSAFVLPVHLYALTRGKIFNLSQPFFKLYFLVLFLAALYNGLYRLETIVFDLGLLRYHRAIKIMCLLLFFIGAVGSLWIFFGAYI